MGQPTAHPSETSDRLALLRRLLSREPLSGEAIATQLGISQATLSRTIHEASADVLMFRLSGQRTPMYGLRRPIPHASSPQPIHRVGATGNIETIGSVTLLEGGGTVMRMPSGTQFHEGLPPSMVFAAPTGFLGRQVAAQVAKPLGLPAQLREWSDDHRAAFLFALGADSPGNLVFGDAALEELLAQRQLQPVAAADKLRHYTAATTALMQSPAGSSAGGEQPKFTCEIASLGHVIVKFARAGTRMADLLMLEQLALASLANVGLPAASATLLRNDDTVFLEVQRFDRQGRFGRLGVLSAGSIDDEYFDQRDNWSDFAARCVQQRFLPEPEADIVRCFAAFSQLIGNTDTHFENLSLMLDEEGHPSHVAPAYDMLPMRYASLGGGIDPALIPIQPQIGRIGARPDIWATAFEAASMFWQQASALQALSAPMRRLADDNLLKAAQFVAPLLPS